MADAALTGRHEPVSPGNSATLSRRAVLAGSSLVGTAAIARALPANWSLDERARADARFWRLHSEWKALLATWEADDDERDEVWNAYSARSVELEDAMLNAPVYSARAIAAKLEARPDTESATLPGPAGTPLQAILWDLERLANLELSAGDTFECSEIA